jgi:hypothetical protein
MNLVESNFRNTESLIREIDKSEIADWLLTEGYFPEQYVLPPTFRVQGFSLDENPKNANTNDLVKREIISISYPKTLLTSREFGIQHPNNFHDIVFYLMQDWDAIIDIIFHLDLKIYSYSFPIPVNARDEGNLSPLRSGRMIYEWIAMAEKDLVAEAHKFKYIVRSDITNFYNSVYTHSIAWALEGQDKAFDDKGFVLTGNKIDRLVQYANNGRTNGLPVGSALSDLLAETILAAIDLEVSQKAQKQGIDFLATRFKDDYRILCNSKKDGETVLKILADELRSFNLNVNETKTVILDLPAGLYRRHDRAYHPHSLRATDEIDFKMFELTLLKALDIHKEYPGTSILEKFFSELFNNDYDLKIIFSGEINSRKKQILKTFSLLILVKRESEKVLCHILAVIESIYLKYRRDFDLKEPLKAIITSEIEMASAKKSIFELVWLIFFTRYLSLGITNLTDLIDDDNLENLFLKSMTSSQQKIFNDSNINLFRKPSDCRDMSLAKRLAVFDRTKEE